MTEVIQQFFSNLFHNNAVLATLFISMLPIIELRGGIPFGMSKTFWGQNAMSNWQSFGVSFLGSCLVVPIIALLFLPIIKGLKKTKLFKKLAIKIENLIKNKSTKIADKDKSKTEELIKVKDEQSKDCNNKSYNALQSQSSIQKITIENIQENTNQTNTKVTNKTVKYDKSFFMKLLGVLIFVAIPLPLTGVWTGTAIAVMLNIPFGWTCLTVILGNFIAGIIMLTICSIFPSFTTIILCVFLAITAILIVIGLIKSKIAKKKNINK